MVIEDFDDYILYFTWIIIHKKVSCQVLTFIQHFQCFDTCHSIQILSGGYFRGLHFISLMAISFVLPSVCR